MRLLSLKSMRIQLVLLSLMHLVTDGLCAYLVFSRLYLGSPESAIFVFFAYNILAFVTQSPVGLLIDKHNKPKAFLAGSIIMMALGYIFVGVWPIAVFFIGMSNSIFHVAGGKYVTDKSGNNISHLGIFVSTGAVGLVLGQRYLSFTAMPYIFFAVLIICGAILIFSEDGETIDYPEHYDKSRNSDLALLAVIGVVVIRSFVGKVATPDFTLEGNIFLIMAIATALGKAMGGVFSKIFGIRPTTYISMSIAALCLTLGTAIPTLFIIGIFAFNFSMPITLYYANILLKGSEGFAFGTLAASLIPGYFVAISFSYSVPVRICTIALCILTMLIIIIVSRRIMYADRTNTDRSN